MSNIKKSDLIDYIDALQNDLEMPICFNFSEEKLKSMETSLHLILAVQSADLNKGDFFALLEILKRWLIGLPDASD